MQMYRVAPQTKRGNLVDKCFYEYNYVRPNGQLVYIGQLK